MKNSKCNYRFKDDDCLEEIIYIHIIVPNNHLLYSRTNNGIAYKSLCRNHFEHFVSIGKGEQGEFIEVISEDHFKVGVVLLELEMSENPDCDCRIKNKSCEGNLIYFRMIVPENHFFYDKNNGWYRSFCEKHFNTHDPNDFQIEIVKKEEYEVASILDK